MLIYLDIDGFKALNRARGQGAGDGALRSLTEALGAVPVVRMGGDEFLVFHGEAEPVSAEDYLQAVLRELAREGLSFCAGLAPLEGPWPQPWPRPTRRCGGQRRRGRVSCAGGWRARASRPALAGPR